MRETGKETAAPLHPSGAALRRFVRGEVSITEKKEVVAHLLRRCGLCAAKIREAARLPATSRQESRQVSPDQPMKRERLKEPALLEKLPQARLWVEAGIRPCCAGRLVRAGYTSIKDLARASRAELCAIAGIGEETLAVLERLLGRPLPPKTLKTEEGGLMAGARRLIALARRRKNQIQERNHPQ